MDSSVRAEAAQPSYLTQNELQQGNNCSSLASNLHGSPGHVFAGFLLLRSLQHTQGNQPARAPQILRSELGSPEGPAQLGRGLTTEKANKAPSRLRLPHRNKGAICGLNQRAEAAARPQRGEEAEGGAGRPLLQ